MFWHLIKKCQFEKEKKASLIILNIFWNICAEGSVNLTFDPALKLKDVEMENADVSRGEYEPPNCTARQSVAILIPHRDREKHLLYLLHHLHSFLQRQQLHYAIYIIQQVCVYAHA